jgi:hypothetical protein
LPPGRRSVVYPGRRLRRPSHRRLISLQGVGHVLVNGLDDRRRRLSQARGILTDAEFSAKKAELLSRRKMAKAASRLLGDLRPIVRKSAQRKSPDALRTGVSQPRRRNFQHRQ